MLFGLPGLRVFILSMAVVPVILVLALAISRMDRVAFDHENDRWLRPLRRPLSADAIASVHLVESLGLVQATVRTLQGSSETLLIGLPAPRRMELVRAIENSSRTAQVHTRRVSALKPVLVLAAVLGIPFAGTLFYFHRSEPAIASTCQTQEWPPVSPERRPHNLGPLRFELPDTWHLTERRATRLQFGGPNQTVLVVSSGNGSQPAGRAGALFLRIADLNNEHDLYRYACCTPYAVIPLLLKRVLLAGAGQPLLTRYRRAGAEALVIRTGSASRILTSAPPLHLWSDRPLPEEWLQELLGTLTQAQP